MNPQHIAEAESKLVLLLSELRGTPTFERAQLWIAKMTGGRKLSEYLRAEGATPAES